MTAKENLQFIKLIREKPQLSNELINRSVGTSVNFESHCPAQDRVRERRDTVDLLLYTVGARRHEFFLPSIQLF